MLKEFIAAHTPFRVDHLADPAIDTRPYILDREPLPVAYDVISLDNPKEEIGSGDWWNIVDGLPVGTVVTAEHYSDYVRKGQHRFTKQPDGSWTKDYV